MVETWIELLFCVKRFGIFVVGYGLNAELLKFIGSERGLGIGEVENEGDLDVRGNCGDNLPTDNFLSITDEDNISFVDKFKAGYSLFKHLRGNLLFNSNLNVEFVKISFFVDKFELFVKDKYSVSHNWLILYFPQASVKCIFKGLGNSNVVEHVLQMYRFCPKNK